MAHRDFPMSLCLLLFEEPNHFRGTTLPVTTSLVARSCRDVDKSAVGVPRRVDQFPILKMGQYFKPVNLDRREYFCPWCLGGGAKLWEWAANPQGAVLTLLLRKSDKLGGGDANCQPIVSDGEDVAATIATALAREGAEAHFAEDSLIGSWAEDRIAFVGDYDSSGLYSESSEFVNISRQLADEWNGFIELEPMQLTFNECGCSS